MRKQLDKLHDHCIELYGMIEKLPKSCINDSLKGYMECLDDIAGLTVELKIEQQEEGKL